ncbi:carboxypeptidase B isoform X1 [Hydra vulgaris]|uniref:carboxypeptidase B isoform X1 n=1 Tax=Hydra vulgaris TaxID=6087 RepID=UPI001F5EDB3D|nr:carboxypeptidase B [Hydra vulgaris]
MNKNKVFLIFLLLRFYSNQEIKDDNKPGPILLRLNPNNEVQVDFLKSLKRDKHNLKFQVWRDADLPGHHVDIWVAQKSYHDFLIYIRKVGIQHEVLSEDLYKSIGHRNISLIGIETFDSNYQDFEEIVAEMTRLSYFYNDSVKMEKIGMSYDGRFIHAITVFHNSSLIKPKIVINCGVHAREWLAISSCKYVLRKLVFNQNYDADISKLLKNYDVTIIPILNPDGYIYSKRYRMWRKSRSKTTDQNCNGVDINRNFGYRWGSGGSSSDVCAETYCGTHPFSEIESLSLARFLYKNRRSLKAYIDVHTFGQMWITPWGFTHSISKDYKTQENAMKRIQLAIKINNNVTYQIGRSSDIMYQTSGDALDWVYGRLGIVHTYGVELRPTLQIKNGFVYSRLAIVLSGEDLMVGLKELSKVMLEEEKNAF